MFFNTVFLLGAFHGFVLSFVLAGRKVNHFSNRFMGFLMMVFSLDLAMASFIGFKSYITFPYFIGLDFTITLLYGPLLFLYAKTLISGQEKLNLQDYLHFAPFLFLLVYAIPYYALSGEEKIGLISSEYGIAYGPPMITYLKIGISLVYIGIVLIQIFQYRNKVKDNFSSLDKRNLDWLQWFILGMVILAIVTTTTTFLSSMFGGDVLYTKINLLGITIYVYSIGYMGLRQPEFFAKIEFEDTKEDSSPRYSKSGLDEKTGLELMGRLTEIMTSEKPYINNELSLSQLSGLVGITTHNLTEIINSYADKNFYDFVNSYRVEEVKKRITDKKSENLTILGIGLESGFNSKSSFNSVFKKHTGITPSEFKKSLS